MVEYLIWLNINIGEYKILEGRARYVVLLLAHAEGFGHRPRPFWPSANSCLAFGQGLES